MVASYLRQSAVVMIGGADRLLHKALERDDLTMVRDFAQYIVDELDKLEAEDGSLA